MSPRNNKIIKKNPEQEIQHLLTIIIIAITAGAVTFLWLAVNKCHGSG
jgi:hypothetical protein